MAFDVINPHDGRVVERFIRGRYLDLQASRNVYIPALCMAIIPHDVRIDFILEDHDNISYGPVWLARIPGVFMSHSLFVDCGPVNAGVIQTEVFNLSSDRILVREGDCISRLVAL